MLHAAKPSIWGRSRTLSLDGRTIGTLSPRFWRTGGELDVDGASYTLRATGLGRSYTMSGPDETIVATANRIGSKQWTVQADGHEYRFQRQSLWKQTQLLMDGEHPVGSVRRVGWRGDADAELPGMSTPCQVFVICVVLMLWDRQAATS